MNAKNMESAKVKEMVTTKPSETVGKILTVTVDSGKDSTKACQGDIKTRFKTRVARRSDLNQVDMKEAFMVTYNGEAFVVGDSVNIQPDLEISKTTIEHKVCIYSAIAQLVPNGSVVNLVIGIPVLLFLDEETRSEYVSFMSQPADQEWTEIVVKGEPHYFKINQVKALPESSGYIFSNYKDCLDDLVGVVDIGGLNINGCVYSRLNPVHQTCFTINKGGHHLRSDIRQKLIQQLRRDIQDYQMDNILGKPKKSEAPIIKEVIGNYINLILTEMRAKNWDISEDGIPVVLTGGTSQIIGKYADEFFPVLTLSQTPVWDNVTGFKIYAEAFMGE